MHLVLLVGAEGGGGRANDGQAGRARGHRRRLRHREESAEGGDGGWRGRATNRGVDLSAGEDGRAPRCEKAVEGSRKSCGAADAAIVLVRHRQKRPGARSVVLTSTATVLTRFLQVLTCFTTGSRVLGSSWPTTAVEARWSTWSSHSCICMQRYRLQHLVFPHHLSRQSSVVMQASFHAWRVTCANLS